MACRATGEILEANYMVENRKTEFQDYSTATGRRQSYFSALVLQAKTNQCFLTQKKQS